MRLTRDVVEAEIKALTELKPTVLQRSMFGDNHHDAIDAQIAVLQDGMGMDTVLQSYGDEEADEFQQNVLDAAIEAYDWMVGDQEEAPSKSDWSLKNAQPL